LHAIFDKFYHKAVVLRAKYKSQIRILVGFETEYIRPETISSVKTLLQKYSFDYCVGSIHHVLGIPIDYNYQLWEKARQVCGGTDESLFAKYFDEQYDLLVQVKPLVVGHFDVIRLWSPDKMIKLSQWPSVWSKVGRNIETVIQYGGVFELNSAAFRKGFEEAYPTSEVAKVCSPCFLNYGDVAHFPDDNGERRKVRPFRRQPWSGSSRFKLSPHIPIYF
jgi:histidinol-phosphatase (PHP family)